jgi:hypothetical protein
MQIVINPDGQVRCLYEETINLTALGIPEISRASHVEPDAHGQWWADLGPVQGPVFGPYSLRSDALQAERTWLERNWMLGKPLG